MNDRYAGMSDFDVVAGNRPADAPEMMRRLKDAVAQLHKATRWLNGILIVLTLVLVVLTGVLVSIAVRH